MPSDNLHNEQLLLQRIAEGDERSFAQLFLHWSPFLEGYLFRLIGSKQLVQEIVQDVFLRIWTHRETLGEINNFKAFLLIICRNKAHNTFRDIMREKNRFSKYTQHITTDQYAGETEYYSLLDEAIDQLPNRRKEVYLMSRHQRMTYDQIAAALSISRESVKTHLKLSTSSILDYIKARFPELTVIAVIAFEIFF